MKILVANTATITKLCLSIRSKAKREADMLRWHTTRPKKWSKRERERERERMAPGLWRKRPEKAFGCWVEGGRIGFSCFGLALIVTIILSFCSLTHSLPLSLSTWVLLIIWSVKNLVGRGQSSKLAICLLFLGYFRNTPKSNIYTP